MVSQTMRVNKWGNSLGIRFPSGFAEKAQIKEKSLVELKIDGDTIIVTKIPENPTIQELFELYPADFIEDEEIDWGEPVGDEIL